MMLNTGDLILDAVILSIVARTPEGTYGYKITQDVRSKMDVPESTFYPLLKQMQMDGYLEVYHKDLGGRSRRFYKITESGLERLEFCQQNWANYLQNAGALLMNDGSAGQPEGAAAPQMAPQQEAPVMQPQMAPQQEAPAMQPQMVPQQEAPVMQEQPQAPPPQEAAPAPQEFHIAGNNNNAGDFDFSIGGDDDISVADDGFGTDDDLFELDSMNNEGFISFNDATAPEAYAQQPQMAYEQPAPEAYAQQPQMAYEQPAPEAYAQQPQMAYEQPAPEAYAQQAPEMAYEQPASEAYAQQAPEMAYEQPAPEAYAQQAPEMAYEQPAAEIPVDPDDEADFLAEMAMGDIEEEVLEEEAPDLVEANTAEETDLDDGEGDIQTVSELESLLSQLRSFETVFNHEPPAQAGSPAPAETPTNINITDVSGVASLLGSAPAAAQTTAPAAEQPAMQAAPAPAPRPAAPAPKPVRYTDVRNKDTEDSLNSLVDLLKDDDRPKKKGFSLFSKSKSKNAPKELMAGSSPSFQSSSPTPVRSSVPPSSGNSQNPAVFSKAYTKVGTPQAAATAESSDIPKPSVSEPKVFKPTAAKSFEAKAASPNARPVETTATITKPLEAKAISTKPTEPNAVETKSVEVTAEVTPKADTAPEKPKKKEDDAIDSFKARLMQAHLLEEEK